MNKTKNSCIANSDLFKMSSYLLNTTQWMSTDISIGFWCLFFSYSINLLRQEGMITMSNEYWYDMCFIQQQQQPLVVANYFQNWIIFFLNISFLFYFLKKKHFFCVNWYCRKIWGRFLLNTHQNEIEWINAIRLNI